jgi:hypothetical protein
MRQIHRGIGRLKWRTGIRRRRFWQNVSLPADSSQLQLYAKENFHE